MLVRLRKTGSAPRILAVAGLASIIVSVVFRLGGAALALVGGTLLAVATVIRLCDLRRDNLKNVPWSLAIIALLLPPAHERCYLNDVGSSIDRAHHGERRRQIWNAVVTSPFALATVWGGWLRTQLVKLAIRTLSGNVARAELALREDSGPTNSIRRHHATLRRLRIYCCLIRCATGSRQYDELANATRALSQTCGRRDEAALTRARQETTALITAMAEWRPDQA